jgi:formamidopyrimidine-DNA glycosylase
MPELPEVESARGLLQAHLAGRVITSVEAADDSVRLCAHVACVWPHALTLAPQIVLQGVTGAQLAAALTGATVVRVQRKGKHLWCAHTQTTHARTRAQKPSSCR